MKFPSSDAVDALIDAALLIDRYLLRERRTLWLLPVVIVAGIMAAEAQLLPADDLSLFGYALPGGVLITILALLSYALLLHCAANARNKPAAFALGFAFGFVYFAIGLFWIFQALSGYIGLPVVAAIPLAALLVAYLALYIGAVCAVVRYCKPAGKVLALIAGAAIWTLAESIREVALTGFPWFAAGYSQVPGGLFAGYAPLGGVAFVNFALILSAALLAAMWQRRAGWQRRAACLAAIAIIIGAGGFGKAMEWTTTKGEVSVSLLQGNVKQGLKFKKEEVRKALWEYLQMAKRSEGRLIILPETALPMTRKNLPTGYMLSLKEIAKQRDGAVIAGMFDEQDGKIYNAAIATGGFDESTYRKIHLTPYGEYLPLASITEPLLRREWMSFFGLSPGLSDAPLSLPFADIGIAICYEDIFGNELRGRMAKAGFLANLTNDGWFDGSDMAMQHLRYSQMRALEGGRDVVRATNTGISAIINHRGEVVKQFPPNKRGILEGKVQQRQGATPYAQHGSMPILLTALLLLTAIIYRARKAH